MAGTRSRQGERGPLMLKPTPAQRALVSRPLGELIQGTSEQVISALKRRFLSSGHRISFSVGDMVTSTLLRAGISFEVAVVDSKVMRKAVDLPKPSGGKVMRVENPSGHLNPRAREVMAEALSIGRGTLVIVDGEEDLLTLFAIDLSRAGDLVVYGQPGEGVVAVLVDDATHRRNSELLSSIPRVRTESN